MIWGFVAGLLLGWLTAMVFIVVSQRAFFTMLRKRMADVGLDPMWQHAKETGAKMTVSVEGAPHTFAAKNFPDGMLDKRKADGSTVRDQEGSDG